MLPVEYVYTEFAQLGEPQMRQAVVQWANGDFPGVTRKVSVPESDGAEGETPSEEPVRRSYHIQALVAKCGEEMGLTVWLPRHDRNAVLREWKPKHGSLVDSLVLRMSNDEETDENCRKTIEQIDVVWLKRGSIVRAFEIEESTHIYSGLLRMADLLALVPNLKIELLIVAHKDRREKVLGQIRRPAFRLREQPLKDYCGFLSYDSIEEISRLKHLNLMSDIVLEEYAEYVED